MKDIKYSRIKNDKGEIKNVFKIDFDLVDAYNSIFTFYQKTKNLEIENPIIEIPLNLIELFKSEFSFQTKKDVEVEDEFKENIFLYLKNKYNFTYNSILKVFNKVLNFDLDTLKSYAKTIKEEENKIKSKIINSNLDNFLAVLKTEFEPKGYELHIGDKIILNKDGEKKGEVYSSNGIFSLKSFSPSLSSEFSKYNVKNDVLFPINIIKSSNIDLSQYIALNKPAVLEQNLKDINNNIFNYDELSTITQIEQIENLNITDTLNNFVYDYKQVSSLSTKYYLELNNQIEKDIYLKLNNDEFSKEDESILFSFQKELNNSTNKIETLKRIKEKIIEEQFNIPKEKIDNYFNFILALSVLETTNNRAMATKIIKDLSSYSKDENVKNILNNCTVDKNSKASIDLNLFLTSIDFIEINKIQNEQDKERLKILKDIRNNCDVNKYSFFQGKQELTATTKYIYQNYDHLYAFYQNLRDDKGGFNFQYIKDTQNLPSISPQVIEYFNMNNVDTNNMLIFNEKDNKLITKDLKTLEYLEEKSRKEDSKDIYEEKSSYIAISRILLLLKAIKKEQKDLSMFSKYFSNKEKISNTVSKLLEYIKDPNNEIKIEFPLNFDTIFYTMNDKLRDIIKDYSVENDLVFNPNNRFLLNLNDKYTEVFEKTTPLVKDYVRLKNFYIQNYNFMDENLKRYIEKNGFKQFFLDSSSMKKHQNFDKLISTLPEDSFLLKDNIHKLIFIAEKLEQNSFKLLNYDKLKLELKIMQLVQVIDTFINNKDKLRECIPFFENEENFNKFIDKLSNILNNEKVLINVTNGLKNFSENGMLFSKYTKITFLNDEIKEIFSEYILKEIEPSFEDFLDLEVLDLKLLPQIEKVDNRFKIKNFMHYFYKELESEKNIVLKLRTRFAQLGFLTLKMSDDVVNKKYFDDKYLPYFENRESLNKFKSLIENDILSLNKFGIEANDKQKSLKTFLRENHMNIKDMIDNMQGYVPGGKIGEYFIEDMKKIVPNKEYYLNVIGITNKAKLSYEYSIMTPEIIVQNEKYKGGMCVGYNLRVTNKQEMDAKKLKNIFIYYYNGMQKNELKPFFNIFNFKTFSSQIDNMSINDLKGVLKTVNDVLESKKLNTMDFIETPKEPASKKSFDGIGDIELKEQSKFLKNIPSIFSSIIKIREMDLTKPIILHINEGCKDSMSLSSILSYSKNNNQFALPLQGTKGFKKEFEEFLFNLPDKQEVVIKLWADLDYAGLTLINHIEEIKQKYPNVKLVSMQELTFKTLFEKKMEKNGFSTIKGADLTDWSTEKANVERLYKQKQIKPIDEYNEEFNYNSDTYKKIALESLELEIQKWIELGDVPEIIVSKISKYLGTINLDISEFKELDKYNKKKLSIDSSENEPNY